MTTVSVNRAASLLLIIFGFFALAENLRADDFGRIVRHIEAEYHVHRNYRFLMSFAGVVVKCTHVGGVKLFKIAIFEDQHLSGPELDNRLDELVQQAGSSGWQPLVRSFSRRSGEHTYIYAKADGNDMKLLLVSVEPDEAVVMQVEIDPEKLSDFINEHEHRRRYSLPTCISKWWPPERSVGRDSLLLPVRSFHRSKPTASGFMERAMGIEPMPEGWEDLAGSNIAEKRITMRQQFRADGCSRQTRVGRGVSCLSRKCNANCRKRRQKYDK